MRHAARVALLLALACGRAPAGSGTAGPGAGTPSAPAVTPMPPTGIPPAATPLPAAPPHRAALVGGCGDGCRDARSAMAGFLAACALAGTSPEGLLPFLDATRLRVDGRDLGSRWAGQWRDLKSATRSAEMRDAARDLGRWTAGMDAAQVRDLLAAGARPVREWSTEAAFEVAVPGAPPWQVTLAPRGVEWLVIEVRRGGVSRTGSEAATEAAPATGNGHPPGEE